MATRNLIMVVDRRYARGKAEGLACSPDVVSKNSYVNMYHHHDGYPQWQGVQIANWLNVNNRQDGSALAAKLVHDMYYDSCYLYSDVNNVDHQYTYIIWTGDTARTMVACHDRWNSKCIFVATPEHIIKTYKDDMDYTDFANGATRWKTTFHMTRQSAQPDKEEIDKYNKVRANAQKIIDILTTD